MTQTLAPAPQVTGVTPDGRPNRYSGSCVACGSHVDEGAGLLARNASGRWVVLHRTTADCETAVFTPAPQPAPERLPEVPAGHYAIPAVTGSNDLTFYRVDRPTEGRWAGYTFVKHVIGGRPAERVDRSQRASVLARIAEFGTDAAARMYGQEIGRCSRCNRHLTDMVSRYTGFGPDCREMVGITVTAEDREAARTMAGVQGWEYATDEQVTEFFRQANAPAAPPTLDERIAAAQRRGNWFVDGKISLVENADDYDHAMRRISESSVGMTMDYMGDFAQESTANGLAREYAARKFNHEEA